MTLLYQVFRDSALEIEQFGEVAVVEGGKVVFSTSEKVLEFPARSLLKPFQYLATGHGDWSPETLDRRLLALGSVSATEEQVQQIRTWYNEPSSFLKFPLSYPMDETHRVHLKDKKQNQHPFFHTCFSKHQMILESCERNGWSKDNYLSVEHPFHKKLTELLESKLGRSLKTTTWVVDGCHLPSPVLPLSEMAKLYWGFANASKDAVEFRLSQAMRNFPQWVGGPKRIDTLLMQKNPGLISKEGADGLVAFALGKTPATPNGLGVIVKMAAGYLPNQAGFALAPILKKYGLKLPLDLPAGYRANF